MPKAASQPPEITPAEPYFAGYVYTPGDAGLALHKTAADFATAMAKKTAQGLVVYLAPDHVMASLMQEGATPEAAQEQWQNQATPYLALLRKMRRRLAMLQLPFENAAAAIQAAIEERMPDASAYALPDLLITPELSEPFWQALAQLRISQDVQTSDMIGIVHSHSIGTIEPVRVDGIPTVLWERWRAREEQAVKPNAEAAAQNTLLVNQIVALEQDLSSIHEDLETVMHDQQAHVQELVAQIDAYGQMVQTLTSARDASQQALELTAKQVEGHQATQADMQNRIDTKNKQIATLTAEREWVRDKRKLLEEEAAAHKNRLKAALADQELASKDHRERTLQMSTQILQLEEAIRLNQSGSNDTAKEALRQMVRQLETSLSMSQTQQTQTKEALHRTEEENAELRAQIDALYASTSWRATRPMRSVSRLVRR